MGQSCPLHAIAFERLPDRTDEFGLDERFGQEFDRARAHRLHGFGNVAAAGDEADRRMRNVRRARSMIERAFRDFDDFVRLSAAFINHTLNPLACSSLISGDMTSSWQSVTTSTTTG